MDLAPGNPYAAYGLADSLRGMGRDEEAAPCWNRVLQSDPANHQAMTRAGDCFLRLGRLERAEQLFHAALDQRFDRAALTGLARLHRERGAPEAAARCLEAILAQLPADAPAMLQLAELLAETRGVADARNYLLAQRAAHPELAGLDATLARLEAPGLDPPAPAAQAG